MNILFLGEFNSEIIPWLESQGDKVTQIEEKILYGDIVLESYDFIISYGYRHIIDKRIIDDFKNKAINLHISYLPWNRGADPNFWSIVDRTKKGVTIHYLDESLDTGDIIIQKEVEFDFDNDTLSSSYKKLHSEIIAMFIGSWRSIKSKECNRIKQGESGSIHYLKDKDEIIYLLDNGWDTKIKKLVL